MAAAQQAAGQLREACSAAAAAKDNAAEAMQSAAQQHAAAAAECGQHERQLQQQQRESQNAVAAEAGARAAAHAAAEQHAVAAMDVQRWSKTVEGIARELAACHRTQQAPVALRLKEARQRLEQHQQENLAAQQQLPQLQAATKAAVHRAAAAQKAVLEVQQCLVASAEHRARLKQQLDAAMEQHEAAAVAAVAAKQQASAAEQQHRLLSAQQQAAVGRLRQMAQQVLSKQQQAVQLANQVQTLQVRHRDAVATMLAAEQQQQRRGKLKRQLQVVQEQGDGAGALPSPTAVQQRHPPPATAAAGEYSFRLGSPAQPVAAEPSTTELEPDGQLVLQAPQVWEDWPCSSSELSSSQPEAAAPSPPLTGDWAGGMMPTCSICTCPCRPFWLRSPSPCRRRLPLQWMRRRIASTRTACCDTPCTLCGKKQPVAGQPCRLQQAAGVSVSWWRWYRPGVSTQPRQPTGFMQLALLCAVAGYCASGRQWSRSGGGIARQRQRPTLLPGENYWWHRWRRGGSTCGTSTGGMPLTRRWCSCACVTCCVGETAVWSVGMVLFVPSLGCHSQKPSCFSTCLPCLPRSIQRHALTPTAGEPGPGSGSRMLHGSAPHWPSTSDDCWALLCGSGAGCSTARLCCTVYSARRWSCGKKR